MWLLIRRLVMTMVAGWIVEKAAQRWPRVGFARRFVGRPKYRRF